jgi:hypothetical protein
MGINRDLGLDQVYFFEMVINALLNIKIGSAHNSLREYKLVLFNQLFQVVADGKS